jgi:hypothetical protein
MEDELWDALYPVVIEEDRRRPRRRRVQFNDAVILLVAMWAVLHDRPIGWACAARSWPVGRPAGAVGGVALACHDEPAAADPVGAVAAGAGVLPAAGGGRGVGVLPGAADRRQAVARRRLQQGPRRAVGLRHRRQVQGVPGLRLLGQVPGGGARGDGLGADERVGPGGGDGADRPARAALRRRRGPAATCWPTARTTPTRCTRTRRAAASNSSRRASNPGRAWATATTSPRGCAASSCWRGRPTWTRSARRCTPAAGRSIATPGTSAASAAACSRCPTSSAARGAWRCG